MTVHGAKGLEAPVVILADTTTRPAGPRHPRLLAIPAPGAPDRIVWVGASASEPPSSPPRAGRALGAAEDEYRRLLYVAMTRAANRLIICGTEGRNRRPSSCWYDLVLNAFQAHPNFVAGPADDGEGTVWRYGPVPPGQLPDGGKTPARAPQALPAWLRSPVPRNLFPTPLSPHPLASMLGLFGRRRLPMVPKSARLCAVFSCIGSCNRCPISRRTRESRPRGAISCGRARAFLWPSKRPCWTRSLQPSRMCTLRPCLRPAAARRSRSSDDCTDMTVSALVVSGQIDRLAVTANAVLIADYKTNRPAPRRLDDVPRSYVTQLALYRAVLTKVYPARLIQAALVWTDVPDLMEFPANVLDACLARLMRREMP